MTTERFVSRWELRIVWAVSTAMAVGSLFVLIYGFGYASGYDAGESVVSDFDFYHRLNRFHLGITIGLLLSGVGLWIDRIRGHLISALGLICVAVTYVWWHLVTRAYIVNSEVTEQTKMRDPYYRNLVFHGANWWDIIVLGLTAAMLIWLAVAVLRDFNSANRSR